MKEGLREAEASRDGRDATWASRAALMLIAILGVVVVAYLLLSHPSRQAITGTWVGHDPAVGRVVYYFAADGSGYRIAGGEMEQLRHELEEGYPNLIRIRVATGTDTAAYNGLVQIVSDSELRLELAPSGAPAPRQLTSRALELRRAASR